MDCRLKKAKTKRVINNVDKVKIGNAQQENG